MQIFFDNLNEIHQYSLELRFHKPECPNCYKSSFWVSHGFTLNQNNEAIGKRILCSNRGANNGCGRTVQLYCKDKIPQLQYDCLHVVIFIQLIIFFSSIHRAYSKASGAIDTRNAYRWLSKLRFKMPEIRLFMQTRRTKILSDEIIGKTKRLSNLLQPLHELMLFFSSSNAFANYQKTCQKAIM